MNLLSSMTGVWCLSELAMARIQAWNIDVRELSGVQIAADAGTPRVTKRKNVAVIPLRGVMEPRLSLMGYLMGGTSTLAFGQAVQAAGDDPSVENVLLDIDSPGGSSFFVQEVGDIVHQVATKKTVVAVVNPEASSGGYWVASQASRIYATVSGGGGSIGAYRIHVDQTKAMENAGIRVEVLRAESSPAKIQNNPAEPLSDEGRAHAIAQLNQVMENGFLPAVARGRGRTVSEVRENFGKGRVFTAKDGVEAGLFDRIATFDEVLSRMVDGRIRLRGTRVFEHWDGGTCVEAVATHRDHLRQISLT